VLGNEIPAAAARDLLRGKVWTAQDPSDQATKKRQQDLTDIARLIEADPSLRELVSRESLDRIGL
jgi:hypothetical protein